VEVVKVMAWGLRESRYEEKKLSEALQGHERRLIKHVRGTTHTYYIYFCCIENFKNN
jgi:hypothetical protein